MVAVWYIYAVSGQIRGGWQGLKQVIGKDALCKMGNETQPFPYF